MLKRFQMAVENPRRAKQVVCHALLSPIGHMDFKKFIILSKARTGSNLLTSYLNSHSAIWAEGEIFQNLGGTAFSDRLKKVFGRQPYYIKAAGFKLFYNHPLDTPACSLWADLSNQKDLHVIHLKRRNLLRTAVSLEIAKKRDSWIQFQSDDTSVKEKRVTISADNLMDYFRTWGEQERHADDRFSSHPVLTVHYEDLVADPERTCGAIAQFLNLPDFIPSTQLKRQNSEPLSQLVINFEELKAFFKETEWAYFFREKD